jgi:hypothetical protein
MVFFNGLGGRTRRTKQTRKGQERSGSGCLGWTGKELLPNTVSYVRKCCREARDRRFQSPADLMPWWIEEFPELWFITFIYIYMCVCVIVWLCDCVTVSFLVFSHCHCLSCVEPCISQDFKPQMIYFRMSPARPPLVFNASSSSPVCMGLYNSALWHEYLDRKFPCECWV